MIVTSSNVLRVPEIRQDSFELHAQALSRVRELFTAPGSHIDSKVSS